MCICMHCLYPFQFQGMARQLAYQLAENAPGQHQGGIHAGVGMEALARYHKLTNDEHIAEYLVEWARYWAATQWEPGRGFRYIHDQKGSAGAGMTGLILYGLAYAHDLSPDEALQKRILEARNLLATKGSGNYAKSFAMMYRNTPRALAHINQW